MFRPAVAIVSAWMLPPVVPGMAVLAVAAGLPAATGNTSVSVAGQAVDGAGGNVTGAMVVLRCQGGLTVARTARTDQQGRFRLDGVSALTCTASATAEGYREVTVALPAFPRSSAGGMPLVTLQLQRRPEPPVGRSTEETGLGLGVPLPHHRVAALIQLTGGLGGDRGPSLATASGRHYGASFSLDGFDVTDPLPPGLGMAIPYASLAAVNVTPAAVGPDATFASGASVQVISLSGSNKYEGAARAAWMAPSSTGRAGGGSELAGLLSGPVIKDKLWFHLSGELQISPQRQMLAGTNATTRLAPVGLAKLTYQVTPHDKLTLLGLAGTGEGAVVQPEAVLSEQGRLLGVIWESLLSDNLVARLQLAGRDGEGASGSWRGGEGSLRLEWFIDFGQMDHAFQLAIRAGELRLQRPDTPAETDERMGRLLVMLEDAWRLKRGVTLTLGGVISVGRFDGVGAGAATGSGRRPAPRASIAWDATADGRTAVRASAGKVVDLGSFHTAEAAAIAGQPLGRAATWELAAGIEREILPGAVIGLEAAARARDRLPGDARTDRWNTLTVQASLPLKYLRFRAAHFLDHTPTTLRSRFHLTATFPVAPALHAAVFVARDDHPTWAALTTAPAPGSVSPLTPVAAAQLRLDLGPATAIPVILTADAFTLLSSPPTLRLTATTPL